MQAATEQRRNKETGKKKFAKRSLQLREIHVILIDLTHFSTTVVLLYKFMNYVKLPQFALILINLLFVFFLDIHKTGSNTLLARITRISQP